jgi:integrase
MPGSNSLIDIKGTCKFNNDKSITLLMFYAEYLNYASQKYKSKYPKSITTLFNQIFKYFDRNLALDGLDYRNWDRFFLQLHNQCPGGAPVYLRTLKAAMNVALEWNYISENPLRRIKLPKRQKKEQVIITVDELKSILDATDNQHLKDLFKTAYYTGLRLSELLNLKFKHIDLGAGFLTVGDENWNTKSRRIREVALSNQIINLLKNGTINKKPEDLLFGKDTQFPYSADYVSRTFKNAVRRKQLNNKIHFHSLRHTYITMLANSTEVSLPALQRLAGHSCITTTMGYVHPGRMDLLKSVSVLNRIN